MCRVFFEKEKIHKNRELTGNKLELIVVIQQSRVILFWFVSERFANS